MKPGLLSFARLREQYGTGREEIQWLGDTVADLLSMLRARCATWANE